MQILIAVTFVQVPVIILYSFIVNNFVSGFQEEQWPYQNTELQRYISSLQDEIQDIDEFLFYHCYNSFQSVDPDVSLLEVKFFTEDLLTHNRYINAIEILDQDGSVLCEAGTLSDDIVQDVIRNGNSVNRGWVLKHYDEGSYMVRVINVNQKYASVFISLKQLATAATGNAGRCCLTGSTIRSRNIR